MDFVRGILRKKIAKFDRVALIHRPTPMRKLARLSAELGGPEIWIKRDDLTGLALGGNKSRKLEFIIADALAKKCDAVVTWGAVQSNWAMQTAAASAMAGLDPVLVLFKKYDLPPEPDGNVLLERLLGADIRFREADKGKMITDASALAAAEEAAAEIRATGRKPYVVSVGGSVPMGDMDRPLGAVAYLEAFLEMTEQTEALDFRPDAVVFATGSGGTQAGLLCGAKWISPETRVVGINVSDPTGPFTEIVRMIVAAMERLLDMPTEARPGDVLCLDDYLQDGYGIVNRSVTDVIRRVFRTEGIVLDPVYTSKAFLGMLDLIGKGYFKKTDKIVFFHTGGTTALFPNKRTLVGFCD
jgi:D-cysteine desulfhydrase family pyridoxal phosphate-dependent enzyme